MLDIGIIGTIWGAGLFATWIGYYFLYMPRVFKRWILRAKWRVFVLDMVIIILGNQTLNQFTGTIVAGIGTMVFGLLCFTFSFSMLSYVWVHRKLGGKRYAI